MMNLNNNTIRINVIKDISKDSNTIEDGHYGVQDRQEIFYS